MDETEAAEVEGSYKEETTGQQAGGIAKWIDCGYNRLCRARRGVSGAL